MIGIQGKPIIIATAMQLFTLIEMQLGHWQSLLRMELSPRQRQASVQELNIRS